MTEENEGGINLPKKDYNREMHTAEHILNQTMVRMFGCKRSVNTHIEKKKSKCDYELAQEPSQAQITEIEQRVNKVISRNLSVTESFVKRSEAPEDVDLSKLPEDATGLLRIIKVGDYDTCACIGMHVENTSEVGRFSVISSDFSEGRLRIRFKLLPA